MTTVFVYGDPVVSALILSLLYNDTPLSQLVRWYGMPCHDHDILQPHVLPLLQRLPGAIFQQANARPHMTRVSQDCPRTVTTLSWPARSPDLFSIEHIWDHLGRQFGHPTSLNELDTRVQ
ncbi:transposable element Tcb2 transposase [Trichonephila clavipes]|nr:transposable element Tcb2 transposase [Trichonephila clavipes]